jgi:alanine racemase
LTFLVGSDLLPPSAGGTAIGRARLAIDLDAIVANWRALDARSGPAVETAAVVKADAYGLGIAEVAPALAAGGVRTFFVALAEEGAALRRVLGDGPVIYVLSGLMPGDAELTRGCGLVPCLNSPAQVAAFLEATPDATCALQFDTGMNRLGIEPAELGEAADLLSRLRPSLALSHLACADAPGDPMNAAQRDAFRALAARFPGVRASLAATAGVLLGRDYAFDLVRPGIGLYGGLPFAAAEPVVALALPVVQVRTVEPGEAVGYGAAWRAQRRSRIATVAAGYADGLLRRIGAGKATLYAGEAACPIVGRVSMDLITADVTDLDDVPDALEILNRRQGVDDLAAAAGTIGYEILTSLGRRYARRSLRRDG